MTIRELFDRDITRRIEEVIKVDQDDQQAVKEEISEYVVTGAIARHYAEILERYHETPAKPHEGIGIWISGFFGAGKSSFAKLLGYAIENRMVDGTPAAERLETRTDDTKLRVLLRQITQSIPTHAVIFDVSTDRGIRSGNQTLTEIMYLLFLKSLGYARDLDLSELEITLEGEGELDAFQRVYAELFDGRQWDQEKHKIAFALSEASRVMNVLRPQTFRTADSWVQAAKHKADVNPGRLAERCTELMKRRAPGKVLLFVIDEVGQFVARDVQKMLDLQAVVQQLGVRGRGRHWLAVTSQERLDELVSGLDDRRVELARVMDRFPLQAHLEPSDISEVTSRRVLSKTANAEARLGKLYDKHQARLGQQTRLSAEIRLPELTRDSFISLYPLLPYQVELVIRVVSGLRTRGGASRHVGGANRTIIKLAQQLLVNPETGLASQPVGTLVRLDHIYDLVENGIGSDIRAKIAAIPHELRHPFAARVAKAIFLLQQVQSVPRTAENIAAALVEQVAGDSPLAEVQGALRELEQTLKVRRGDDGYRIPTPTEDEWERVRNGVSPKAADTHELYREMLQRLWQPQPTHDHLGVRRFKAGLAADGKVLTDGDVVFQLQLAQDGNDLGQVANELRETSRAQRHEVFWAVGLTQAADAALVEVFRSREILRQRERDSRGEDTPRLIGEERARMRTNEESLRRHLRAACLSGRAFFRGAEHSPDAGAVEVTAAAAQILQGVLADVFTRFGEAKAKASDARKAVDALLSAHNLDGLPAVFNELSLLRSEGGRTVFAVDQPPLQVPMRLIEERANYGQAASGAELVEQLAGEPFGWDFEVVRLLVLALVRGGHVEMMTKGSVLDSPTSPQAREAFTNNVRFRQATFRPRRGLDVKDLGLAAIAFEKTFGMRVRDLASSTAIAEDLRNAVLGHEEAIAEARELLVRRHLPGEEMLAKAAAEMKEIKNSGQDQAIVAFNASHQVIQDAIARAGELSQVLTEPRLEELDRARRVLDVAWPALRAEVALDAGIESHGTDLADLLERETFFRSLPAIEQHTRALEAEYQRRFDHAQEARQRAYAAAYEQLEAEPGWHDVSPEVRAEVSAPLSAGRQPLPATTPLSLLRSDRDACEGRLRAAVRLLREMIDGDRLATIEVRPFFAGGIETEEQLDAALDGLRQECLRLIGTGKKVVLS